MDLFLFLCFQHANFRIVKTVRLPLTTQSSALGYPHSGERLALGGSMTWSQDGGELSPSHFHIDLHLSFPSLYIPDDIAHIIRSASRPFDARDCQLAIVPGGTLPLLGMTHNLYTPITVRLRVLHSPYPLSTSTCSLLLLPPRL